MKRIIFLALCLIGIGSTSCENKERLEEIKAELKGEKPGEKKTTERNVSISAPTQNQAPQAETESVDDYNSMSEYDSEYYPSDYSSDYPVDSYESEYSSDYESEY